MRRNEVVKLRKEIGVNTVNELREGLGDDPIVGGDTLYVPNNIIPVGHDEPDFHDVVIPGGDVVEVTDTTTVDNDDVLIEGLEDQSESKAYFDYVMTMRAKKDESGKRMFSDKEIKSKAKKYGIG